MIHLKEVSKYARRCNSCTSENDTVEIVITKGCSGTVIALCQDCRSELFGLLKESFKGEFK